MQFTYINHSGFCVETDKIVVVFDFFRDSADGYLSNLLSVGGRVVYVLASHVHPDHFNPEVLEWQGDICWFFSSDIRRKRKDLRERNDIVWLRKGEAWQNDDLKIEAFGSTDIGVSFQVTLDGKRIFHAGDLNNWIWLDESTPEEVERSEAAFAREMSNLAPAVRQCDVAMFPVDPRIGTDFMRGARQFVEQIHPKFFVPMHFWGMFAQANDFEEFAIANGVRFMSLHCDGETFLRFSEGDNKKQTK